MNRVVYFVEHIGYGFSKKGNRAIKKNCRPPAAVKGKSLKEKRLNPGATKTDSVYACIPTVE